MGMSKGGAIPAAIKKATADQPLQGQATTLQPGMANFPGFLRAINPTMSSRMAGDNLGLSFSSPTASVSERQGAGDLANLGLAVETLQDMKKLNEEEEERKKREQAINPSSIY